MATEQGSWQNVSAGPRQMAALKQAMSALRSEGQTHDELTGVVGGKEHTTSLVSIFSPPRPEVVQLDAKIQADFGSIVTSGNVRQIIAAYEAALPEARKSRRVDDQRRTPEEEAVRQAAAAERQAAEQAERDGENEVLAGVLAKAPAGARALIVAEYHEDTSDSQTDYTGSQVMCTVAIGYRYSSREDFAALRAAAAQFPDTAHMASDAALGDWLEAEGHSAGSVSALEHRENHSMGSGNYLSDHGSARGGTGWVVRSADFPCKWVHLTEDAIPASSPAGPAAPPAPAGSGAVTVRPSSTGRAGYVEVVFTEKPPAAVRKGLKAHGFRWAPSSECWYGRDAAYAESLRTTV
jgi:hypothetical protein